MPPAPLPTAAPTLLLLMLRGPSEATRLLLLGGRLPSRAGLPLCLLLLSRLLHGAPLLLLGLRLRVVVPAPGLLGLALPDPLLGAPTPPVAVAAAAGGGIAGGGVVVRAAASRCLLLPPCAHIRIQAHTRHGS